jgi:small subunit ribosomal protein S1
VVAEPVKAEEPAAGGQLDLSAFSSMLKERWKSGSSAGAVKTDEVRAGQIRSFRITKLDQDAKTIEVQLA